MNVSADGVFDGGSSMGELMALMLVTSGFVAEGIQWCIVGIYL